MVALRTQRGKLALYSNWREGTLTVEAAGQEFELYDYCLARRALWSCSTAPAPPVVLEEELWVTLEERALPGELRAPLPASLRAAQRRGFANYQSVEELQSYKAYAAHLRASEPAPTPD